MSPTSMRSTLTGSIVSRLPFVIAGSRDVPKARKLPARPSLTFHITNQNMRPELTPGTRSWDPSTSTSLRDPHYDP